MNKTPEVQINIGTTESIGKRFSMEDRTVIVENYMGDPNKRFVGLFDGHGGYKAAEIAARNLPNYFHSAYYNEYIQRTGKNIPQMLTEAFVYTDQQIEQIDQSGTTAIVVYQDGHNVTIANAGDSRAVLVTNDGVRRITYDNKATNPSGIFRVTRVGGIIRGVHLMMPNGNGLAVSRALGDREYRNVVIPNPNVYQGVITKNDKALILACDGVWDVVSDDLAANIVKSSINPKIASRHLVAQAYGRGSGDNLSAVVIGFTHPRKPGFFSRIFSR